MAIRVVQRGELMDKPQKILKPTDVWGLQAFLPTTWRPVWHFRRSPQKGVVTWPEFIAHCLIVTI